MDPPCKYTKCKKEEINRGEAESDENQTVLIRTTNKQARKYVLLLVFSENMNKSYYMCFQFYLRFVLNFYN